LGIDMSRLARSNKDWHHLLEMCALIGTVLGDDDGIYDPNDSNDRLLLGLKGTISEFELVTMRNRLHRAKLHKKRYWIAWADGDELRRLRRLLAAQAGRS